MKIDMYQIIWAIENKKVIVFRDALDKTPAWNTFEGIFDKAILDSKVSMASFASLTIDNSETYTNDLDKIINSISEIHPGEKIAAMSIVHFYNKNDNNLPKEAKVFFDKFVSNNHNKLPHNFDFSLLTPTRHSDPVDGFYIQCNGDTLWRIFYDENLIEYTINPGDIVFIPKGIEHSVESLNVRSSLSISFFDQ